jgi:hypothetical protein
MSIKEQLLRWKFTLRSIVAREPSLDLLHKPVIWWTQYKMRGHIDIRECRVGRDTEFVLDGFQGSGNTFATRAFKYAQTEPVRIAHHLHSPAQIIKAVEYELPVLVTIRNPVDAVASLISRWPYVTPEQALHAYIGFYQKIEPYAPYFVVSPFPQTTNHLDIVLEAVNERFGTHFTLFAPTSEHVNAVRDPSSLESDYERHRRELKQHVRDELKSHSYQATLNQADQIHARLIQHGV